MSNETMTPPRRVQRVVAPARPVWETAFRDPVIDIHISLRGLSLAERHLARVGLVTLALLLVSVLFTDTWRSGTLLPLGEDENLTFLPVGLLPVTLGTFLVAWTLLTWGALVASPAIRLAVAAAFLLTNATLGVATSIEVGDNLALRWGPDLVKVGYFLPAGVLVLSALVSRLPRLSRRLLPVFRLLCLGGLCALFLGHLWVHTAFVGEGFQGLVQELMSGTITEIDGILLPLVYVSGILVIDFSLDVAEGVAVGARQASRRLARWLLAALIAVKLYVEVGHRLSEWVTYVQDRPTAVARTLVSVALLALVVRLVTKFEATGSFNTAKERLMYGSGVVLALDFIVVIMVVGAGIFALAQLETDQVPSFVTSLPDDAILDYTSPVLAGVAVMVGLWLLTHPTAGDGTNRPLRREIGSGLVVMGCWALPSLLLNLTDLNLGFSDALVDIAVTVGVAGVLAARWRTIDTAGVVTLAAITVFSWLVMSRGDWISVLGGVFGLPVILVVVVGIAYSLLGDAGFTRSSSRRLPPAARVLMFVGYLTLSVTILHWVEATHATSYSASGADSGFFLLGIPWAAWLVGRRLLHLRDDVSSPENPVAPVGSQV